VSGIGANSHVTAGISLVLDSFCHLSSPMRGYRMKRLPLLLLLATVATPALALAHGGSGPDPPHAEPCYRRKAVLRQVLLLAAILKNGRCEMVMKSSGLPGN